MPLPLPAMAGRDNDITARERIWRRFPGDSWAAFDALPAEIRRRLRNHAYDPWSVNALMLWRAFHRQTGSSAHAARRLLRWLDDCEATERGAFAEAYRLRHRLPLPHVAAGATVLRAPDQPIVPAHSPSRQVIPPDLKMLHPSSARRFFGR